MVEKKRRRSKKDYINNERFHTNMLQYKRLCEEAELDGKDFPPVPEYIGKCILDIAYNLATKGNFSGYSYKDDMISDGIENALRAVKNYDPDAFKNPFAYFTRIIYYAFVRRIQAEHKFTYTKYKVGISGLFGDVVDGDNQLTELKATDAANDFIENYERKLEDKRNRE